MIKRFLLKMKNLFKVDKSGNIYITIYNFIWNVVLISFLTIVIAGCFVGSAALGYFASLVEDMPIPAEEEMLEQVQSYDETTTMLFSNGESIGNIRTDLQRKTVTLDQISPYIVNAVVSTEDEYFFDHHGVVPKATLRALAQEALNTSSQSGGSTLTQQLVKNQILTNEVSHERKAKEILLAMRLENFMTKNQIIEAYLNMAPFGRNSSGQNIAGIQTAAKGIFGVNASDVTLPQAAFLAGLPQNPFTYSPFKNEGGLKEDVSAGVERMHTVLKRMYSNRVINKQAFDEAMAYDITQDFIDPLPTSTSNYPWLTTEVQQRVLPIIYDSLIEESEYTVEEVNADESLKQQFNELAENSLRQGGLTIYTTINKDIYESLQDTAQSFDDYASNKTSGGTEYQQETGAILIDNDTGAILGFVGGRNHNVSQINHATQAKRQNGSTMKPLLVYGPAIEEGLIQPSTLIEDKQTDDILAGNYDENDHGWVSARDALKHSYNIPAVKIYKDMLNYSSLPYLEKMGFTSLSPNDEGSQSAALGGITNGVTVEENVNAYATFANGGYFVDAFMISKIEGPNGEILYEHQHNPVQVFSPETSYLMIDMMRDVVKSGTAGSLNSRLNYSTDLAGKTGTTNNYNDIWFVGTNPNVTFGTWMGYDVNISQNSSTSRKNLQLWAEYMNNIYKIAPDTVDPDESFKQPSGVVTEAVCSNTGKLATYGCSRGEVKDELFNANYLSDFEPNEDDIKVNEVVESKFVTIDGVRYPALSSTPAEFTQTTTDEIEELTVDDGTAPSPVQQLTVSGDQLIWTPSPESDILGYYVYKVDESGIARNVQTVYGRNSTVAVVEPGYYYVMAVDIAGYYSPISNQVTVE